MTRIWKAFYKDLLASNSAAGTCRRHPLSADTHQLLFRGILPLILKIWFDHWSWLRAVGEGGTLHFILLTILAQPRSPVLFNIYIRGVKLAARRLDVSQAAHVHPKFNEGENSRDTSHDDNVIPWVWHPRSTWSNWYRSSLAMVWGIIIMHHTSFQIACFTSSEISTAIDILSWYQLGDLDRGQEASAQHWWLLGPPALENLPSLVLGRVVLFQTHSVHNLAILVELMTHVQWTNGNHGWEEVCTTLGRMPLPLIPRPGDPALSHSCPCHLPHVLL